MIRPLTEVGLSKPAFLDKSTLPKGLDGPFVEVEDSKEDAVEAEFVEGERQEKLNGFGAISLAEMFSATDDDPELSIATAPIDTEAANGANALAVLTQRDCERAVEWVEVRVLLNETFDLF